MSHRQAAKRRPLGALDWVVAAGAVVNLAVVLLLLGYWATH